MKKLFLFLSVCALSLIHGISSAQTFSIVGTGTTSNDNVTYPAPFGNYYWGARHQFFLTAAQISAAGVASGGSVVSFGFNVTATNSAAAHQNFQIRVYTTTNTNPISAGWVTTGLVAQTTATNWTPVVGWNQFTLQAPFNWNGTDNLVIETCFNNGGFTVNASTQWTTTGLGTGTWSRWRRADATGVCASTLTTTTSTTTRPNVRIGWNAAVSADLSLTALPSPSSLTCGGANQTVTVTLRNSGSSTWNFATNPATVVVSNTGATVNNPIGTSVINTGTLAAGATTNVTVSTTFNMSANGTYRFRGKVTATGDAVPTNDSLRISGQNFTDRFISRYSAAFAYTEQFPALPTPPYLVQQVAGTGNWAIVTSGNLPQPNLAPTNPGFAFFNSYAGSFNGARSRLVLPCMDFSLLSRPQLKFKMSQSNRWTYATTEGVYVVISTDGGATWSSSLLFAPRLNLSAPASGAWTDFEVNLCAYGGNPNVRIGLEALGGNGDDIGIDELVVSDVTCPVPGLGFVSAITPTSATLNWGNIAGCGVIDYTLQYGPVGGPYTTINGLTGTSYTVSSGLVPGGNYQFHVSANCGAPGNYNAFVNWLVPYPPPINDNCPGTTLATNTTCVYTAGTTLGATASPGATSCVGTADDDVWYQFTTTAVPGTSYEITVQGLGTFDAVIAVYTNSSCITPVLVPSACRDATLAGATEVLTLTGLTPSTIYRIRVYDYYSGTVNQGNFNICVRRIPPPPANDNPCGATGPYVLPSGPICTVVNGHNAYATPTTAPLTGCASGNANDDVWFSFVATSVNEDITVVGNPTFNAVVELLGGPNCSSLSSFTCADFSGSGGTEVINAAGLSVGTTYYVRVYDFGAGFPADSSFTICVNDVLVLNPPPANDNCASPTLLTTNPTCVTTAATTVGATNLVGLPGSLCSGFVGNADDDVWFRFQATSTAQVIRVFPQSPLDAIVELRSDACNGTLLSCINAAGAVGTESLFANGLTVGSFYRVRVYGSGAGPTTQGTFDICVKDTVAPAAPANDNCAGAVTLTSGATCSYTTGNVFGATASTPASVCGGTADDDVWYQFTATSTSHNVQVLPSAGFDAIVQVLSGASCAGLTSVVCQDFAGNGGLETVNLTGLTIGQTYRIRVYDFGAGQPSTTSFQICVTTVTPPPPLANDNCSGAISLTPGPVCLLTNGTVAGATASGNPVVCPFGGTANDDVWYSFVATSTIHKVQVNGSASFDAVLQIFTGTGCGSLASLACEDATLNGGTEVVNLTGLTIGNTYYVRVFDWYAGTPATQTFTICVVTIPAPPLPVNDLCANSLDIACGDLIVGQNSNGGTSAGDPTGTCGTDMTNVNGIWYKTLGNGNSYEVSTCNFSNYDTKIAVYTGACGSWTCVAGNDDDINGCGNGTDAKVSWTTTNGVVYYILVGGFGGAQGIFQLELACCNVPTVGGTTTATPTPASTVVNDLFTFGVTGQTGAPISWEFSLDNFATIAGNFVATGPTIDLINNVNGTVWVRAIVANGPGCLSVPSASVAVTPRCASAITGQPPVSGNFISNVTFANVNNNSTFDASGDQYQNFQAQTANVQRGFSYALQIKTPGTGLRGRMAWIDYNNDGDFNDPGEAIITPIAPVAGTTTSIVTIPCIGTGTINTRMRVLVADVTPNTNPCAPITYGSGEIEEYSVSISGVGFGVWIGAVDNNWNNPANWACNTLPNGSIDVVFPVGAPNLPAQLTAAGTCRNITFNTTAPFFTTTGVNLNGFNLDVKGDWIVSGSPSASVVMSGCSGAVVFSGTLGVQNINGVSTFGNVTINNAAGVNISKATGVNCVLRTQLGALTTNNLLTLRSSLTTTGLVDPTGTGSISGNLNIQRRIGPVGGYHYLSAGVSGANVANATTGWADDFFINPSTDGYAFDPNLPSVPGNLWPSVWEYDETNPDPNPGFGWIGATSASDAITPLKGFACITPANAMVDVFGPANTGTVNYNVTKASDGANLLGNPYPSPISWNAFIATNGSRLAGTYAAFVTNGGYAGNYGTWNGTTGTLGVNDIIASSQAFFVTATSAGAVTAQNSHRTTTVNPTFFGYTSVPNLLRMEVQGNNMADEAVVYFDPNSVDTYSTIDDGGKIFSTLPGVPGIYTIADNHNLSINAMGRLNQDRTLPLGVRIQTGGQYNLVATDFSSFGPSAMLYLEDVTAGTMQNLRVNNTYSVQLAAGDYSNRFFLHVRPAVELGSNAETCAGNDGAITVNYPSTGTVDVNVLNANGQSVSTLTGFNGSTQISNLADGNYSVVMTFNGTYQATDYVQVSAGNGVSASINASTQNVDLSNNAPVVFTANVSGATSYTWNFGDGTVLTNAPANVSHTFTSAGVYEVRFEATNQQCTSTVTTTVTALAPTGIVSNVSEGVKVFGVENRVTVQFGTIADGKGRIEVLNMLGQNLVSVDVASTKGTREIEVPNVAVGHYMVRVTTADKVYTQKVYLTK